MTEAVPGSDALEVLLALFVDSLYNDAVITAVDARSPRTLEDAYDVCVVQGRAERRGERRAALREAEVQAALGVEGSKGRSTRSVPTTEPARQTTEVATKPGPRRGTPVSIDQQDTKTLQGEIKALRRIVDQLVRTQQGGENMILVPQHAVSSKVQGTNGPVVKSIQQAQRAYPGTQAPVKAPVKCWTCGGGHLQRNCPNGGKGGPTLAPHWAPPMYGEPYQYLQPPPPVQGPYGYVHPQVYANVYQPPVQKPVPQHIHQVQMSGN